jgi:predicted transposase YdaD
MQTNDELWKGIIEDIPREFLRRFFNDAMPFIDFTQPFVFLDKELSQIMPESEDMPRRVDKLLQVTMKGGDKQLFLVHAEVQGYWHADFAEREFIYYYRLYDRYKMKIATLVIFTDPNKGYKPSVYRTEFLGTEVTYKYRICKVMDLNPDVLAASKNLFDAVLLSTYWSIKQKRKEIVEEDLLDLKLDLIRRLHAKKVDKLRIGRLLNFIKEYIRFEKPNINAIFDEKYHEIIKSDKPMGVIEIIQKQKYEKGIQEGIEKGIEQGIEKGIEQGIEKGIEQGIEQGIELERIKAYEEMKQRVDHMREKGLSLELIADFLLLSIDDVIGFFNDLDNGLQNSKQD